MGTEGREQMPGGWGRGAPWNVRDEEGRGEEEEDSRTAVARAVTLCFSCVPPRTALHLVPA